MLLKNVTRRDEKDLVITSLEILALFIGALLLLILLFPKDKLKEQVMKEKSNYDLTATYLQNLIRIDPNNSKLVLTMAKTLSIQKRYNLAKSILEKLSDNEEDSIREEAVISYLEINNILLEKEKDPKKIKKIIDKNRGLLRKISLKKINDLKKSKTLYYAALSINDKESAIRFSQNLINLIKGKEKIKWFKYTHYLAVDLNKTDIDKSALIFLSKNDKNDKKEWLQALSTYTLKSPNIDKLIKKLQLDDESKAYFYLLNKKYEKSAKLYKKVFEESKDPKNKRELFITIIDSMRASNKTKKAAILVHKYEDLYISDKEIRKKLLKLYLEANRADFAKKLSLKIMAQRGSR
jgi:hypothetical protein